MEKLRKNRIQLSGLILTLLYNTICCWQTIHQKSGEIISADIRINISRTNQTSNCFTDGGRLWLIFSTLLAGAGARGKQLRLRQQTGCEMWLNYLLWLGADNWDNSGHRDEHNTEGDTGVVLLDTRRGTRAMSCSTRAMSRIICSSFYQLWRAGR